MFHWIRRFHWILLNIEVDRGRVQVMDSLNRDMEQFRDMKEYALEVISIIFALYRSLLVIS
jgi:hypothetical protein